MSHKIEITIIKCAKLKFKHKIPKYIYIYIFLLAEIPEFIMYYYKLKNFTNEHVLKKHFMHNSKYNMPNLDILFKYMNFPPYMLESCDRRAELRIPHKYNYKYALRQGDFKYSDLQNVQISEVLKYGNADIGKRILNLGLKLECNMYINLQLLDCIIAGKFVKNNLKYLAGSFEERHIMKYISECKEPEFYDRIFAVGSIEAYSVAGIIPTTEQIIMAVPTPLIYKLIPYINKENCNQIFPVLWRNNKPDIMQRVLEHLTEFNPEINNKKLPFISSHITNYINRKVENLHIFEFLNENIDYIKKNKDKYKDNHIFMTMALYNDKLQIFLALYDIDNVITQEEIEYIVKNNLTKYYNYLNIHMLNSNLYYFKKEFQKYLIINYNEKLKTHKVYKAPEFHN